MEPLYLEDVSLKRKEEIKEYIEEFITYQSDINGIGPLNRVLEGIGIEEAIESTKKEEETINNYKKEE